MLPSYVFLSLFYFIRNTKIGYNTEVTNIQHSHYLRFLLTFSLRVNC